MIYIKRMLIVLGIANLTSGNCQNRKEDFVITLPEQKIGNSFYSTIDYIDSRYDRSSFGIVQLGAFNNKAKVIPRIPLAEQLKSVMNALTDSTAANGKLLLQLRQFYFAEVTGAMSERGYCYLRAELYNQDNELYRKINSIDTVIVVKAMDVTKGLFKNGSKTISSFIAESLTKPVEDTAAYTLRDIANIDSIEKQQIKVYRDTMYVDGLYATYASFMKQRPDRQVSVEMKKEKIAEVRYANENGKTVKVKAKDIYAVVHNRQPFIATDYGYYPLEKSGDDFYFTGKAKVTANTGDVIAASMFFGIIGGLIASDANATFEMKIDHKNGGFIRLKEIKTTRY